MQRHSSIDRAVLRVLALCVIAAILSGCMASAATTLVSQTVKTTAKATGAAARITMDGARAVSHTVTRPFRKDEPAPEAPVK